MYRFFCGRDKSVIFEESFLDVEIVEAFYPFWLGLHTLGYLSKCKPLFQVTFENFHQFLSFLSVVFRRQCKRNSTIIQLYFQK